MKITPTIARVAFLASVLVTVVVYWSGLHGDFFFDDGPSVLQPEGVRLERLNLGMLRQALASGNAGPSGRPIAQLSFALNHYFSGFSPFAFKATNLAIHLAGGVFVFLIALRLLAPRVQRHTVLIVTSVLAAVWLLHPIQLLPVLHVVQRMTSLSALFLLAAFLLHMNGRQRNDPAGIVQLIVAWSVLWPLAFFSKETGALFPCFVLAWELTVRRNSHGGIDRFAQGLTVVLGLALAAVAAYAVSTTGQWLWAGYDLRTFTLGERLLTEGRVLWFYLGLIVLPRLEVFGLYHDDIALSTSLLDPWTTLPALSGLAGLIGLAWWARSRVPLVSFGILWFLIGHGMESTALPLEIAHEHRNYVPLFGVLLAGGWLLSRSLEITGPRKTLGIALASVALLYFPFVTALRAHQFGDDLRRTQIEAQHHRLSAHAQYDAGRILAEDAEAASASSPAYAFARAHFELAGEIDQSAKMSWLGLISLNCTAGKPAERAWIEQLSRRLRETPFGPADRNVIYGLKELAINGALCLERADVEGFFTAALANSSVSPYVSAMLHSWQADYLTLAVHDLPAAQLALDKSLAIAPDNASNQLKSAQLAYLQGRRVEAGEMLGRIQDAKLLQSEKDTKALLLGSAGTVGAAK